MLGLYLGTSTISCIVFYASLKAYDGYLKRNHYVSTTKSKGRDELRFDILSYAFKALLPGYNIYIAVKMLWEGSRHFEDTAYEALKNGKIRLMTEDEIKNQEAMEKDDYIIDSCLEEKTSERPQISVDTRLAELERQKEELEKEKEFLLSTKIEKTTKPVEFKIGQK